MSRWYLICVWILTEMNDICLKHLLKSRPVIVKMFPHSFVHVSPSVVVVLNSFLLFLLYCTVVPLFIHLKTIHVEKKLKRMTKLMFFFVFLTHNHSIHYLVIITFRVSPLVWLTCAGVLGYIFEIVEKIFMNKHFLSTFVLYYFLDLDRTFNSAHDAIFLFWYIHQTYSEIINVYFFPPMWSYSLLLVGIQTFRK